MKELSRVNLYMEVQNILESQNDDRYDFIFRYFNSGFRDDLLKLLNLNISILRGIEDKFLISSDNIQFSKVELENIYIDNIRVLNIDSFLEHKWSEKLKLFSNIIHSSKNEFYAFNSLIKMLTEIGNYIINHHGNNNGRVFGGRIEGEGRNQVFLSHAFDDKLYSLVLFIFMYRHNIFLYVDWMFSPEFRNGKEIKKNLFKEIQYSGQLLFLRTVNSELAIRGSANIRGWCSWELGTFYSLKGKDDKFYIELYKSGEKMMRNKQLDGIKPLRRILRGRLE